MSVNEIDDPDRIGPSRLGVEFAALASRLKDARTVRDVLDRVARAGLDLVAGADFVSVTLRGADGTFHTPVETDQLATELDRLQYRLDEGPCVEATRTPGLGMVASADLAGDGVFPHWGPPAARLGVGSALAVGLAPTVGPPRVGALNFYSRTTGGLDGADQDVALVLAAHASVALASSTALTAADLEATQLRAALQTRDVIGQAKGILMERRGISADEAFDVLRRASQSLNLKLTQVAETVATRRAEL